MTAAPTVLRGRAEALSAIDRALLTTAAQGDGAVLLARGEDGAGKTALVRAARERAATLRFRLGAGVRAGAQPEGGPTVLRLLLSGPRPLVPTEHTAALEGLLTHRMQLAGAIAGHLRSLSAELPLMLTVDDADRADPLSRYLLSELPARLADRPILWLLTGRPDAAGPAGDQPAISLDLKPLTHEELTALAADRLGAPIPDPLRRMLAGIAGNPRLASLLVSAWRRARAAGEPDSQIPTGFVVAVRETLAGLPTPMADGLKLLAVLGRPVAADAACTLAGVDRETATAWLIRSTRHGFLATRGHELAFRHDLVRETVYADLSQPVRRRLHRRCADFLTDTGADLLAVAQHVRAAAHRGDGDSAALLLRTAEDCAETLPGTAADLALDSLSLLDATRPGWARTAERCVALLTRAERGADAVRVADQLLAHIDDADIAAQTDARGVLALLLVGRPQEALERADARLARPPATSLPRARLEASRALALTRLHPAVETDTARSLSDPEALGTTLRATAEAARTAGRHGRSLSYFRRARQAYAACGPAGEILALQLLDRYRDAGTLLREAWDRAGNRPSEVLPSVLHTQMWQDFSLGRLADAEQDARTVIDVAGHAGDHSFTVDATMVLAAVALTRGDVAGAHQLLDPPAAHDLQPGPTLLKGWLAMADGSAATARDLLAPALADAWHSSAFGLWWPSWLQISVRAGLATGDYRLARDAAALAVEGAARNPGVPSFDGLAHHLSGLVDGDVEMLGRAAETLAGSPRVMLRADAAYDHGVALIAAGRHADGNTRVADAARIYEMVGAAAPLEESRRVMPLAGGRRAPATGFAALTPAERRVARLISAGHTSRSAARQLGVSPNTINTQVTSIYAKLGVRSRVQLTNAVFHAEGPPAPQA